MIEVIKLYEAYFPGKLIGKEVVTEESKVLGVCTGVLLDLTSRRVYLLVSNRDFIIKIDLEKIIDIDDSKIRANVRFPIEDLPQKSIEEVKEYLKEEMLYTAKLIYSTVNIALTPKKNNDEKKLNMARLFYPV